MKRFQIDFSFGEGSHSYDYFNAEAIDDNFKKLASDCIVKKVKNIDDYNQFAMIRRSMPKRIIIREYDTEKKRVVKDGLKYNVPKVKSHQVDYVVI